MPTYEYHCDACEHGFEVYQSMLDKKLKKCPECGKLELHRLIGSGTGIIFKGSGFYETDYKNNSKPSDQKAPAEDKPATKTESKAPATKAKD